MLRLARPVDWIAAVALAALIPDGRALAEDATYGVGRQGWSLERFGTEVTLLRSATASGGPSLDEAVLILSCDGADHRLRLSFPAGREPPGLTASRGVALIRAIDRAGTVTSSISAPFAVLGGTARIVTITGGGDRDPVLRVAGMLRDRSIGLDLLLRPESRPVTLGRMSPLRLFLVFGANDEVAFHEFLKACR